MNCYIDAGNSRIKGRITRRTRAGAEPFVIEWPGKAEGDPVGALATQLAPLLVDEKGRSPKQIVLASVVEAGRREWLETALIEICPEAKRRWLSVPRKCCHVRVAYAEPAELGIDRFCAMIEAYAQVDGRPLAVINAGTAITLDVLAVDGQHRGGLILPGWRTQLEGLLAAAPGLREAVAPLLEATTRAQGQAHRQAQQQARAGNEATAERCPPESTSWLGVAIDTATAVELGCHWMIAAGVNQMLSAWQQGVADEGELAVVISGGDAERLAALVDPAFEVQIEPDLVLSGVVRLARARR
ncbi:MAG TPA: type III pantothenate kinase [Guyparkeria sp.]|nr:type III pantothenate kinase [Guyparkeria sp.]